MNNRILTNSQLTIFGEHLRREEKSKATIEKYLRDVKLFLTFSKDQPVTKEVVLEYKQLLMQKYATRSVNSMLASLNSFLTFCGLADCRVKSLKQQKDIYCPEEKELTKSEYQRLLKAAQNQPQLQLLMQTICATGIRISELKYFSVEAVRRGEIPVRCKNKTRTILVPGKLKSLLLDYAKNGGIRTGAIFVTKNGTPLDRSYVWAQMKKLAQKAGVKATKVFPHNLRKLFARTFYSFEKDIAKLADILGHSSIETTRIYIMCTGVEHRRKMEQLGLIMPLST